MVDELAAYVAERSAGDADSSSSSSSGLDAIADMVAKAAQDMGQPLGGLVVSLGVLSLTEAMVVMRGERPGGLLFELGDALESAQLHLGPLTQPAFFAPVSHRLMTLAAAVHMLRVWRHIGRRLGQEDVEAVAGDDSAEVAALDEVSSRCVRLSAGVYARVAGFVRAGIKGLCTGVAGTAWLLERAGRLGDIAARILGGSGDGSDRTEQLGQLFEAFGQIDAEMRTHGRRVQDTCLGDMQGLIDLVRAHVEAVPDIGVAAHQAVVLHMFVVFSKAARAVVAYRSGGQGDVDSNDPTGEEWEIGNILDMVAETAEFEAVAAELAAFVGVVVQACVCEPAVAILGRLLEPICSRLGDAGDADVEGVFPGPVGDDIVDRLRHPVRRVLASGTMDDGILQGLVSLVVQRSMADVCRVDMVGWARDEAADQTARLSVARAALSRFLYLHEPSLAGSDALTAAVTVLRSIEARDGAVGGTDDTDRSHDREAHWTPRVDIMDRLRDAMARLVQGRIETEQLRIRVANLDQSLTELAGVWPTTSSDSNSSSSQDSPVMTLQEFGKASHARSQALTQLLARHGTTLTVCDSLLHLELQRVPETHGPNATLAVEAGIRGTVARVGHLRRTIELIRREGYLSVMISQTASKLESLKTGEEMEVIRDLAHEIDGQMETLRSDLDPILRIMDTILKLSDATPHAATLVAKIRDFEVCWQDVKDHVRLVVDGVDSLAASVGGVLPVADRLGGKVALLLDTLLAFAEIHEFTMEAEDDGEMSQAGDEGIQEDAGARAGGELATPKSGDPAGMYPSFARPLSQDGGEASGDATVRSSAPAGSATATATATATAAGGSGTGAGAGAGQPRLHREQTRNVHAVNVLKRIRAKLDGRDTELAMPAAQPGQGNGTPPSPSSNPKARLSVADQVDRLIREAMNPDHLAVMYEGWMSWI
ncbi:hypothetical protein BC831DRAFT_457824 [Entophlyctis helioformis]|nr:hypothetical protein BC831DRAFT_457824 [Entophlyctis helioformis]